MTPANRLHDDRCTRRLIAAVILQAVRDAREGDTEAGAWLVDDGLIFFDVLGLDINPERIRARLSDPRPFRTWTTGRG